MRTKNKILLGLAASSGVVASFGAAFALYTKTADNLNIGIGAVESYGDSSNKLNYLIDDKNMKFYSDENLGTEINNLSLTPDTNNFYLKVPLGFEYEPATTDVAAYQDYAVGTLKVAITIDDAILAKGNVTATAKMGGYSKATGDADTYFTKCKSGNFFTSGSSDNTYPAVTFSNSMAADTKGMTKVAQAEGVRATTTVTHYIDTAIENSGQYCVINLNFDSAVNENTYLDIGKITEAFKVTLNWGDFDTTADRIDTDNNMNPNVYVRGNSNDWSDSADYRMVPNVKKECVTDDYNNQCIEWMYQGLTGFDQIKVKDNTISTDDDKGWISYSGTTAGVTNESGNAKLDKTKYKYGVYYVRAKNTCFTMSSESIS